MSIFDFLPDARQRNAFLNRQNQKVAELLNYYLPRNPRDAGSMLDAPVGITAMMNPASDVLGAGEESAGLMDALSKGQKLLALQRLFGLIGNVASLGIPGNVTQAKQMLDDSIETKKVPAKAKSPDLEVSPAMKYKDVPVVNPRDLIGMTIKPTVADLLDAGRYYKGIDSSYVTNPEPLLGGGRYPMQQAQMQKGLGWADTQKTAEKKIRNRADLLGVANMKSDSHISNQSFNNAMTKTMMAYVRDNRLAPQNVKVINQMVRDAHTQVKTSSEKGKQSFFTELKDFPGFDSPNLEKWLNANTGFETKKKIASILMSKQAQNLGAPRVASILNATVDKSTAGFNTGRSNARDTLLLLKPNYDKGLVELGKEGFPSHPSYSTGLFAEVFGRFANPVSMPVLYSDFYDAQKLKSNEAGIRRAFDLKAGASKLVETLTPQKVSAIERSLRGSGSFIEQAGQAQVAVDMLSGNWKPSTKPYLLGKGGGLSPVEFEDAIKTSPYRASLTNYTAKEITEKTKKGTFEAFQLGDNKIFFGIDKNPDYSYFPNFKPQKNDKALVGVVSNEVGVSGMSAPATVLKSIEEGVTVLDAFNVKSEKYPDGFLPEYYADFGFEVEDVIPFDKDVYLAEHTINDYNDLINAWTNDGWNPKFGMPEVVVMRYKGNENGRSNATKRFFTEDKNFLGHGEATKFTANARGSARSSLSENDRSQTSSGDNISGDTGSIRKDNTKSLSSKSKGIINEVLNLTFDQAQNLDLNYDQLQKLKKQMGGGSGLLDQVTRKPK